MWRDILVTNRKAVLAPMDAFDDLLMHLRDLVQPADARGIRGQALNINWTFAKFNSVTC